MPSEKTRSKEDTWRPEELEKSLKEIRGDKRERRKHGDREDREKEHHRRRGDDVNGDEGKDKQRRRRTEDTEDGKDRHSRVRDDDRRSRHRGGERDDEGDRDRRGERKDKNEDDDRRRRDRDGEGRRHRRRDGDEENGDRKRNHDENNHNDEEEKRQLRDEDGGRRRHRDRDDDGRKHQSSKDRDERKRPGDRDGSERRGQSERNGDDERRRRSEKPDERRHRPGGETEDRPRRTKDKKDDDDSRRKPGDRRERKTEEKRDRDKDDRRKDRDKESGREEKDRRKDRNEDKRRKSRDEVQVEERVSVKSLAREESTEGGDDYEDDFEDYEEDFEEDDEDTGATKPQNEVDEVLRALDAENDRLMSESRRSNWSDSTELSDERFKPSGSSANKQRTFINFVSAKQRVITDKASSKTRRRGRDLLQLIDLDVASYDMFDLPPVKEYDLYIRNFGRSDTRQVYIQTNEDNIDRDIQTEEIEYREKWSQHPPEDSIGCGRGDGEKDEEEFSIKQIISDNTGKLTRFIHRAGQAIAALLDEELASDGNVDSNSNQSNISVSQGYTQLGNLPFLEGRCVQQVCFAPSETNTLLTRFSPCQQPQPGQRAGDLGFVCVWNISEPSFPQRILVSDSQPTSCCFSPSNAALVFAGTVDGSLVLWDLREPSSLHPPVKFGDKEFSPRYPTYNTAGVLEEDNHQSAVVTVTHTISSADSVKDARSAASESGSGLSFQLVSVDELATVNLWVVAEISSPDLAGSESDLGLSPGGRVKLIKSSSIILHSPVRDARLKTDLKVTGLELSPVDPNQFIVGTDGGFIVHGVRFGSKALPRAYVGTTDAPVEITSMEFSPFCKPCFLAGCGDGTVRLYHTLADKPLMTWSPPDPSSSVVSVKWSRSRPAVFFILYSNSTVLVYDLVENDSVPATVDQFKGGRPVTMCFSPDHSAAGSGEPNRHPQLVFTLDTGKAEVHKIVKTFVEQQPFEDDFLTSYIDRF